MNNKFFRVFLLSLAVLVSACQSHDVWNKSAMTHEKSYFLTDNYANHRAQQLVFESSGGKIAYLDNGEGPVLVMLHGVPSSSWLYRKMIPGLQEQFRVIVPDFLGYGSSEKPDSKAGNYASSAQAEYIRELLKHLSVAKYSLLFHDMGGLVAWDLVSQDIEQGKHQVQDLFVLNTIISQLGFNHPKMEKGMVAKQYSRMFSGSLSSAMALNMTFDNMGLSTNAKLSEAECRGYVLPMREGSDQALYEFYTGFDEELFSELSDNIASLKDFEGEVHVYWGEQDKVLTSEQIGALMGVLPSQSLWITPLKNNSHFLPEEMPDELVSMILGRASFKR